MMIHYQYKFIYRCSIYNADSKDFQAYLASLSKEQLTAYATVTWKPETYDFELGPRPNLVVKGRSGTGVFLSCRIDWKGSRRRTRIALKRLLGCKFESTLLKDALC